MSLFSSSSSSPTTSSNTSQNYGVGNVEGQAVVGNSGPVNVLDAGAIKSSFDFAKYAQNQNAQTISQALNLVNTSMDHVNSAAQGEVAAVSSAYQAQTGTVNYQKILIMVLGSATVIGGLVVVAKTFRGSK